LPDFGDDMLISSPQ